MSYWRRQSEEVILPILMEFIKSSDRDIGGLKKKISLAYPFGERKLHPYKVWLKVVKEAIAFARRAKGIYGT